MKQSTHLGNYFTLRVPVGTPLSIWDTWEQLNWNNTYQSNSVDEDCSFFHNLESIKKPVV